MYWFELRDDSPPSPPPDTLLMDCPSTDVSVPDFSFFFFFPIHFEQIFFIQFWRTLAVARMRHDEYVLRGLSRVKLNCRKHPRILRVVLEWFRESFQACPNTHAISCLYRWVPSTRFLDPKRYIVGQRISCMNRRSSLAWPPVYTPSLCRWTFALYWKCETLFRPVNCNNSKAWLLTFTVLWRVYTGCEKLSLHRVAQHRESAASTLVYSLQYVSQYNSVRRCVPCLKVFSSVYETATVKYIATWYDVYLYVSCSMSFDTNFGSLEKFCNWHSTIDTQRSLL